MTRSLLRIEARALGRQGQDLSDLGTEAEGEEKRRQRQSQRGPQTGDAEILGFSDAEITERGQELTLIFSYRSQCNLLSTLRYERTFQGKVCLPSIRGSRRKVE